MLECQRIIAFFELCGNAEVKAITEVFPQYLLPVARMIKAPALVLLRYLRTVDKQTSRLFRRAIYLILCLSNFYFYSFFDLVKIYI